VPTHREQKDTFDAESRPTANAKRAARAGRVQNNNGALRYDLLPRNDDEIGFVLPRNCQYTAVLIRRVARYHHYGTATWHPCTNKLKKGKHL